MSIMKKQNVFGWLLCAGAVLSIVSLIIYVVNCGSYPEGTDMNTLPILFPIIAVVASAVLFLFSDKLDDRIVGFITFVIGVLIALACWQFIVDRVYIIGEQLNPVNHPEEFYTAVNVAITGIVFYAVTMLVYIAVTIGGRLTRKN